MASETERIEDQFRRACEGRAWHGPSLKELLAGVDAGQAVARPIAGAHSIWELVLHLAAWEDVACRRVSGENVPALSPSEDWPAIEDTSADAWSRAQQRLEDCHRRLRASIAGLPDQRLSEVLPTGGTVYSLLHGVVQHDLYHAGQIALLKKIPAG